MIRKPVFKDPVFSKIHSALEQNVKDASCMKDSLRPAIWRDLKERRYHLLGGLNYRRKDVSSALVVLEPELQLYMLDTCHDHLMAGHFSQDRTLDRLRQIAWWLRIA